MHLRHSKLGYTNRKCIFRGVIEELIVKRKVLNVRVQTSPTENRCPRTKYATIWCDQRGALYSSRHSR
ncbi:hypothetical protein CEXT_548261 [Caerostris extrusa]|uniref:Uncharacterized protein n=1 Tax=Caerostris extrusa TaxID=172846 RepID=A0AAV4PBC4_CAEEX|nr:hypothetical protein CEXT_548261 [Caerostris extrusa]